MKKIFTPNQEVSAVTEKLLWVFWILFLIGVWIFWPSKLMPGPSEVWATFIDMWFNDGLGQELITSFKVQIVAVILAVVMSLSLAYLSVIPFFRPLVKKFSSLRFVSISALIVPFMLFITSEGYYLKLLLLVWGISVFYTTSMLPVITNIDRTEFDNARTLKMGEWRATYVVVIKGKLDVALDALRQNAAIGWMMLLMVEGLVRSGGGIGVLAANQIKHNHLPQVFVIIFVILIVGIAQDLGIQLLIKIIFPYADLGKERN